MLRRSGGERVNRVMASMLAKRIEDKKGDYWPKILKNVEYSLKNTVNRSTNSTPSHLLFCVEQKGESIDDVRELVENHAQEKPGNREILRETARENIERSQGPYLQGRMLLLKINVIRDMY